MYINKILLIRSVINLIVKDNITFVNLNDFTLISNNILITPAKQRLAESDCFRQLELVIQTFSNKEQALLLNSNIINKNPERCFDTEYYQNNLTLVSILLVEI